MVNYDNKWDDLPPYRNRIVCRKCNHTNVEYRFCDGKWTKLKSSLLGTVYIDMQGAEHMIVTCITCGAWWREKCADSK